MPKKSNTKEFIEKANKIHSNQYNYSMVNYKNNSTKVHIICPQGHSFFQTANSHLNGRGCSTCANKNITTERFVQKAKMIHCNKYDYSKSVYKTANLPIEIICYKHGNFFQRPYSHLAKKGCFKCGEEIFMSRTKTLENFIKDANKIHHNIYDYSLVDYKNCQTYIDILCIKHGVFKQKPTTHLTGRGCPICNNSKGELEIWHLLELNNIEFILQYRVEDFKEFSTFWKFIKNCKYDFYLPEYNIVIEYHGIQHYTFSPFFHGNEKEMLKRRKRDNDKKEFCLKNNIGYYEIGYNKDITKEFEIICNTFKLRGHP
jgi:hypothetical protein